LKAYQPTKLQKEGKDDRALELQKKCKPTKRKRGKFDNTTFNRQKRSKIDSHSMEEDESDFDRRLRERLSQPFYDTSFI
jgi:hypothetical protein